MGVTLLRFVAVGLSAGIAWSRITVWRRDISVAWSMAAGVFGSTAGAALGRWLGYSLSDPPTFVTAALGAVASVATYVSVVLPIGNAVSERQARLGR